MAKKQSSKLWKLECLRGLAAYYVFLCHFRPLAHTRFDFLFKFGPESVMLFFLLSGFVIYYASCRPGKRISFRDYFSRRFARIYPLLLISLAACLVLAKARHTPASLATLGGNLLMLQDMKPLKPGVWVDTFAGNFPLWSLSYEWWFYMMFWPIAVAQLIAGARQRSAVFVISVAGFLGYQAIPNQPCLFLGYFFIWWCGVEMAREFLERHEVTWRRQVPSLLMLGTLVLLWSIPVLRADRAYLSTHPGYSPMLQFRHMLAAFIFLVSGIAWHRLRFIGFGVLFGAFGWIAPISYASYIFHRPILGTGIFDQVGNPLARLILYTLLLWTVCYILEVILQPVLSRMTRRLILPASEQQAASPAPNVPVTP